MYYLSAANSTLEGNTVGGNGRAGARLLDVLLGRTWSPPPSNAVFGDAYGPLANGWGLAACVLCVCSRAGPSSTATQGLLEVDCRGVELGQDFPTQLPVDTAAFRAPGTRLQSIDWAQFGFGTIAGVSEIITSISRSNTRCTV